MTTHIRPSRRLRRALPAILLLIPAAGVLAACDRATSPPVASTVPAGPQMIDNGGHRLAFYVTPGAAPVIVLDSGGGEDHTEWTDIAAKLHAATGSEIITYDRAGMGASDEVPGPWKVEDAVSDLKAGLTRLGVTGNVVLVAHSQAGEIATYFVRQNPRLVSGAVLVDANLPPFFTDDEIARLVVATKPQVDAAKAGPSTGQSRQLIATAESFVATQHAYHQVAWPDAVPAVVIVSEKTPFDGSPEDVRRWRDAAKAFAAAGPGRTLVNADGSSHEVPADRPGLVLAEVEKMVTAGR